MSVTEGEKLNSFVDGQQSQGEFIDRGTDKRYVRRDDERHFEECQEAGATPKTAGVTLIGGFRLLRVIAGIRAEMKR